MIITQETRYLKNWPCPYDKTLLKCSLCHIFLFDILGISVKIGVLNSLNFIIVEP